MKLLIVEDEPVVASRIQRQIRLIWNDKALEITWKESLDDALDYLSTHEIDLLLLDLNLHGADGFKVLETVTAKSFHTIIISAYSDKAITAFEYGVLDFIAKPFTQSRLAQALQRVVNQRAEHPSIAGAALKHLAVKKNHDFILIAIREITFIKADGHYSVLHLANGNENLHSKRIDALLQLLPAQFVRVHRSYVVNWSYVERLAVASGGYYHLVLNGQQQVPVSRSYIQDIKARFQ
jgi:two-component system response regulator LytT